MRIRVRAILMEYLIRVAESRGDRSSVLHGLRLGFKVLGSPFLVNRSVSGEGDSKEPCHH